MSDLSTILSQFAQVLKGIGFVGIVAGVTKGFEWADGGMNNNSRLRLTQWLKNVRGDQQIDAWANVFPSLIDRVFGRKAFSFRFFTRSSVASLVAVATVSAISWASLVNSPYPILHKTGNLVTIVLFMGLTVNCVFDYFSLLVSRIVVRVMASHPSPIPVLLLLLCDVALTGALSVLAVKFLAPAALGTTIGMEHSLPVFEWGYPTQDGILDVIILSYQNASLFPIRFSDAICFISEPFTRVFILASFFTSVWVWLYVLASVAIRILHKVRFIWAKLVPFLSVEDKPMQAIGRVAGLLAGMSYLALVGVVWLCKHL